MKELSLNILDILENSCNAGAGKVELFIREDLGKDVLDVSVTDNGKGMDKELVDSIFGSFKTTKTTKKVALGLPILKGTMEMCGGDLEIESKKGEGTRVHFWCQRSHWDLPPMGDLALSIATMLTTHPNIDFGYKHRVGTEEFNVSTSDFKEIFGDIPLSSPVVFCGIEDFLRNNINKLYDGGTVNGKN